MKHTISIIIIILCSMAVNAVQEQKATLINRNGEILFTNDGGKTWLKDNGNNIELNNLNIVINKFKYQPSTSQTAILIKGGTQITNDGGKTWLTIQTENKSLEINSHDIILNPNPVVDKLNIKLPDGIEILDIQVFDVLGGYHPVSINIQNKNESNINCSGLNSGIYFLKIKTKTGTGLIRIVKM